MASVQTQISQLPTAGAITGDELVPIVQNGLTVQTTTGAISASPSQTQTFLTVDQEPTLPNSRALSASSGITLTDGGAQAALQIGLDGAAESLNAAGTGIMAKTASDTVTARSIASGSSGLSVANGNGVSGNPTISLTGQVLSLANASGAGLVALPNNGTVTPVEITGTSDQTTVANGTGAAGNPTIGLASNPVLPGTASVKVPAGTTAERPASPANGMIRYNTDTALFEGYLNGSWSSFASGSGVTSVATGTGLTGGPITSTGTISIANTGVTAGSYVAADITVNAQGQITAVSSNSSLVSSFSAGSTGLTPSTATSGDVTLGGTLAPASGGTGANTLTGYVYGNGTGTMTASTTIPNVGLANSSLTIGSTNIALGATSTTLAGLTSVTLTQDPTADLQAATKQYVDSVAQGLNVKTAALWGTTGNITLSGLTTQAGGEWTGSLTAGDRILVKNQLLPADNGIYAASAIGWTRTLDANAWDELVSAFVFVQDGATLADTGWVCTVNPGGTLGVTAVTWSQFSGAGTYSAGTGLTLSGTQFSISNTTVTAGSYGGAATVPTYSVNAQGQLTAAANVSIAIAASQVTSGTLPTTYGGTGLSSFTAGDITYYSSGTALSKLGIGATDYILTSSGTAPQYTNPASITVGTATAATNLAGGIASQIPYQTGAGATSFIANGTAGQVLTSAGTSVPAWGGINGGTF